MISELKELLKDMKPELIEGEYYISSIHGSLLMNVAGYLDSIVCIYREDEGLTVVGEQGIKELLEELSEEEVVGPFALITLNVHSDLMAVGFLAKITETLAEEKISVNAFSAYHHDHLLVPFDRKDDAMKVLRKLQAE
jgi:hypothetical protein